MTSFVNLMANDVWSETDIVNRTESLVRSEFSLAAERILNRKIQGATLGQYVLTNEEMGELQRFAVVTEGARQAGTVARADMALLLEAMKLEVAQQRLTLPVVEAVLVPATDTTPATISNQPELDKDAAERSAAQAAVDAGSVEANTLYLLRNPVVEVVPELVPEVQP